MEDHAEVVAYGGEDDVGGIALAALEVAAVETDHGLDGGAAVELAFDRSEDGACGRR
jgi:hypothetical protein